mmetsp:Transcript_18136/g.41690  ORF Transcript_18136/g.41690 Transcript_18136/m.41690 type:complete len:84 (-) Transcript_18136:155-406(-)
MQEPRRLAPDVLTIPKKREAGPCPGVPPLPESRLAGLRRGDREDDGCGDGSAERGGNRKFSPLSLLEASGRSPMFGTSNMRLE